MELFVGILIGIGLFILISYLLYRKWKKEGYTGKLSNDGLSEKTSFDLKDLKFLKSIFQDLKSVKSPKDTFLLLSVLSITGTKQELYVLTKASYKELKSSMESDEGYAIVKRLSEYEVEGLDIDPEIIKKLEKEH